jgi:hypothetical protein
MTRPATPPVTKAELIQTARSYLASAKQSLAVAPRIDNLIYTDADITSEAAATACIAALKAIDAYVVARGIYSTPQTMNEYKLVVDAMSCANQIYPRLTIVFQNLHLFAYQCRGVEIEMIKSGMRCVKEIIDIIEKTPY